MKNSLGNFSVYDVKRFDASDSHVWGATNYGAVSKSTAEAESWLISPKFDLNNISEPILTFDTYYKDITTPSTYYTAYILTNFDGTNISTATKTALSISFKATLGTQANSVDLKDYKGQKITIAFKYQSPEDFAGEYEIVNFSVKDNANTKGTYEDPYTCAELLDMGLTTSSSDKGYVIGYIVGSCSGNALNATTLVLGNGDDASESNILIAANATETNYQKCVSVKGSSNAMKKLIHLKGTNSNSNALGKKVIVYGTLKSYLGTAGVNTATYAELYDGDTKATAGTKPSN